MVDIRTILHCTQQMAPLNTYNAIHQMAATQDCGVIGKSNRHIINSSI